MRTETSDDEAQAALWAVKIEAGTLSELDEARLLGWLEKFDRRRVFLAHMLKIQRALRSMMDAARLTEPWLQARGPVRGGHWMLP